MKASSKYFKGKRLQSWTGRAYCNEEITALGLTPSMTACPIGATLMLISLPVNNSELNNRSNDGM